jgi:hypothetical protein
MDTPACVTCCKKKVGAQLSLIQIKTLMNKNILLSAPFLVAMLFPLPSFAQAGKTAGQTPATPSDLETYIGMGAVVSCELMVNQKLSFQKAIGSAASMVTNVIANKHGGRSQGNPGDAPISNEQLFQNSVVFIVSADKRLCYPQLPSADQQEVDKVLAAVKDAQKTTTK